MDKRDIRTLHEPGLPERIKDAVCVDCSRIYDSCADKDCLEEVQVFFPEERRELVEQSSGVRLKDVRVLTVLIDTEKVPFNKGFYTVDMTFYFNVELELCRAPGSCFTTDGICFFNKKVMLYGCEGSVSSFSSEFSTADGTRQGTVRTMPKATVQVAEPVGLEAHIVECCECCDPNPCIPPFVCQQAGYREITPYNYTKKIFVSLGLFSIVQLQRNVQLLLPAYDFCVPENASIATTSDNPCDLFRKIEFPSEEFFPLKNSDCNSDCGGFPHKNRCDC